MARRAYFTGARRPAGVAATSPVELTPGRQASSVAEVSEPVSGHTLDRAIVRLQQVAGDSVWLDGTQIAEFLGISPATYYRLRSAKVFPIPEAWPKLTWPRYHVDDIAHYLRTSAQCHASQRLRMQKGAR